MKMLHCSFAFFAAISFAHAQTPQPEAAKAAAAITSQQLLTLRNAHTLFVANAGTDYNYTDDQPAGATGPYNQLYARMATWGRFQLTDTPAKADIVLEVHASERRDFTGGTETDKKGNSYIAGTTYESISLDLTLLDRATNNQLWTSEVPCTWGSSKAKSIQYFAACTDQIVRNLQQLTDAADASNAGNTNTPVKLPPSNTKVLASAAPIPAPLHAFNKLFIVPPTADDADAAGEIDDRTMRLQADLADCCGFTIVTDPAKAELVATLHGYTEIHRDTTDRVTTYPENVEYDLDLFDPATHILLWSINSDQSPLTSSYGTENQTAQRSIDRLIVPLKQFNIPSPAIETVSQVRASNPTKPLINNSQAAAARTALQAAHTVYLNFIQPAAGPDTALPAGSAALSFQYLNSLMKSWGHYTLTTDKSQADLVLNLETVDATTTTSASAVVFQQLTIVDPKTQRTIWTVAISANPVHSIFANDLVISSMEGCIAEVKVLEGQTLSKIEKKMLTVPDMPFASGPSFLSLLGLAH